MLDTGQRGMICFRSDALHMARSRSPAFTLVEIMVVVVIVGILAVMLVAGFRHIRETTQNSRLLNDFRIFEYGFLNYNMTHGIWPDSPGPGILPPQMLDLIKRNDFEGNNYVKGIWVWEGPGSSGDFVAAITLANPDVTAEQMTKVDERLDDGNLSSGRFRANLTPGSYTLIIQE